MAAVDETERGVEIKVRENGPYRVQGPIRLIDADGEGSDEAGGPSAGRLREGEDDLDVDALRTNSPEDSGEDEPA